MPRVLTCIDPTPSPDGTCANEAWVDQGGLADYLPTTEQANVVGFMFFATLLLITVAKRTLKPQRF